MLLICPRRLFRMRQLAQHVFAIISVNLMFRKKFFRQSDKARLSEQNDMSLAMIHQKIKVLDVPQNSLACLIILACQAGLPAGHAKVFNNSATLRYYKTQSKSVVIRSFNFST